MQLLEPRSRYETEKEAEAALVELLTPHFTLFPQVGLRHLITGQRFRIDFVGVPKLICGHDGGNWACRAFPADLVGFEVKASTYKVGEFTRATGQATDYMHSVVDDPRARVETQGRTLPFIFIFPAPFCAERSHEDETFGIERAVGQFNVGLVWHEQLRPKRGFTPGLEFTVSGERIWSEHAGCTVLGTQLRHGRKRGSR